jgi:radical SAM superfamily enzyme YgiQ (UPF0313 family)
MRILFIYTDINIKGGARSFNYGIAILSAILKEHGHETDLYYMYPNYETKQVSRKISEFEPQVIGFYSTTSQFGYLKRLLEDIPLKEDIFTICGGPHVTVEPETSLHEIPRLDAVCCGEGEYPLLELVEALEKNRDIAKIENIYVKRNGEICRNLSRPFIENLDDLPFPDRELFQYQKIIDSDFGTALFMFTRGCPFNCSYCANYALSKAQSGKYVRFRSAGSCITEIKKVLSSYTAKAIYVNDDLFTLRKDFVFEFCERYKEEIALPFDINTRVGFIDKEICACLKDAGCRRVNIGIESGSPYVRNDILNRKMSNKEIIEAFRIVHEAGLKTKSFNMIGLPGETPEHFQETIDLNAKILPDSVILNVFDPYPGTKLGELCEEEDLIDVGRAEKDFIPKTDTVLNLPDFPREKIHRFYKIFAYEVYKKQSFMKAIFYRVYYSEFGELLIRLLSPFKSILRRITMGI